MPKLKAPPMTMTDALGKAEKHNADQLKQYGQLLRRYDSPGDGDAKRFEKLVLALGFGRARIEADLASPADGHPEERMLVD